ncbi:diguanylate cyclase [Actinomarinicola tropica]|uniref:diguanylate cyclase n=1 Tax=Actinomarinicola tropica TaxID=2789776 RepID=UPI0018978023|nr:diguanylate cyclase [Actinomarinicola tropica]
MSTTGGSSDVEADAFRRLAAALPGVIFSYEVSDDRTTHRFPFIGDRIVPLLGLDPDELARDATPMFEIIDPEDRRRVIASISHSARRLTPWHEEARLHLADGTVRWFDALAVPEEEEGGAVLWYGQLNDIHEHKELEEGLRAREAEHAEHARYQRLIAELSAELLTSGLAEDLDASISRVLEAVGDFFDAARTYLCELDDELSRATDTHEWCRPGVPSLIAQERDGSLLQYGWWRDQMAQLVRAGRVLAVDDVDRLPAEAVAERSYLSSQGVRAMLCVPIQIHGRVEGFVGIDADRARDWSSAETDLLVVVAGLLAGAVARHRLERELVEHSVRDPLTGLHNRRYLLPRLAEMAGHHRRTGAPYSVAMIDIDHFKVVNDRLGHAVGDGALRCLAEQLTELTRGTDVVARFGGEEFVIALPDTDQDGARAIVGRIVASVRERAVDVEGQSLHLTVSAGVATTEDEPATGHDADGLLRAADRRLYRAKSEGRDRLADAAGVRRP